MTEERDGPGSVVDASSSPAVAAFLGGLGEPFADLDATIHPGDAMARFASRLSHGVREAAWLEYFRSGHAGFAAVDQLLRWRFGAVADGGGPSALLDFGCGHGRVTRFLARALGEERVIAAEVDPSGVDFVRRFGVRTLASSRDPSDFEVPTGVDAIVALSVLSHLPEAAFREWIRRWWSLLVPGGLLIVSVLDERVLLPGRELPDSGFHFERMSESDVLDFDDYGTSWVDEAFVRDAFGDCLDIAVIERLPLGLWHLQDLWVVVKGPAPALASLRSGPSAFDPGPEGYLEGCELSADRRRLELRGWARASSGSARVVVSIDGVERAAGEPTDRRDDLPRVGGDADDPTGFRLAVEGDSALDPRSLCRVEVRDPNRGSARVLHLGSIEAADLFTRLTAARAEADRLRDLVAVFEGSGFGRLRRRWMALKKRLGA